MISRVLIIALIGVTLAVATAEARTKKGFGAACAADGYNWKDGDGYVDLCQRGQRPPAGNRWHSDMSKRYQVTDNFAPTSRGKGVSKGGRAYSCKDSERVTVTPEYVRCAAQAAANMGYGGSSAVNNIVSGCGKSIAHALDEFGITCRKDAVTGIMGSLVYETRNFATFIQPCDKGVGGFHMTDTNWRSMGQGLTKNFNKWFGLSLSSHQMQDAFMTRGLAIHAAAWWWARKCSSRRPVTANTAKNCIFAGDGSQERIKVYNAVAACESKLGRGRTKTSASSLPSGNGGSSPSTGRNSPSTGGSTGRKDNEKDGDRSRTDKFKDWLRGVIDKRRKNKDTGTPKQGSGSSNRSPSGTSTGSRTSGGRTSSGNPHQGSPSKGIAVAVNINQSSNFWARFNLGASATINDVKLALEKQHGIDPKWCSVRQRPNGSALKTRDAVSKYLDNEGRAAFYLTWP